jgi:hypothetical protein
MPAIAPANLVPGNDYFIVYTPTGNRGPNPIRFSRLNPAGVPMFFNNNNAGGDFMVPAIVHDFYDPNDPALPPFMGGIGLRAVAAPAAVGLNVFAAPHIGNIGSPPISSDHENAISREQLVVGQEYVRVANDNHFIYDPRYLQEWFNTGHNTNPLTNLPVLQNQLERFTYTGAVPNAASMARKGGKHRKSRRSRKYKNKRRSTRKNN